MSTRTLIELNHDHSVEMNSPEFLLALQEYLARPSQMAADVLSGYGVHVYGTQHSDSVRSRGFRDPHYDCHYTVQRRVE